MTCAPRLSRSRALLVPTAQATLLALLAAACASAPDRGGDAPDPDAAVLEPWSALRMTPPRLAVQGPAPAPLASLTLPAAADVALELATVSSEERALRAVIARPLLAPRTPDTPAPTLPGVVLFHEGHALTSAQLSWAVEVARNGFVVLLPTLRGENGNAGAFELLRGEVEDARAAVRLLATEPDVDVDHLYAFGVREGGALAALLALDGEVPLRIVGSVDGVLAPSTLAAWRKADVRRTPFAAEDVRETQVRALVPFAHQVELPLVLYTSRADAPQRALARTAHERAGAAKRPVTLVELDGDSATVTSTALRDFLARAATDAALREPASARPVAWASRP